MFNFFRKLLTGYNTVIKNMNGSDFRFMYSGKPVFFDPLQMLTEFAHRSGDQSVQVFTLSVPSDKIDLGKFRIESGDLPSVICTFSYLGKELKVSRYTQKEGIHPESRYLFESEGISFGSFCRTYDYGSQLEVLRDKIALPNQSQVDPRSEGWLWKNEKGEMLFLEKFGHSQLWKFSEPDILSFWARASN